MGVAVVCAGGTNTFAFMYSEGRDIGLVNRKQRQVHVSMNVLEWYIGEQRQDSLSSRVVPIINVT